MSSYCPICGRKDEVQKLSWVVMSGRSYEEVASVPSATTGHKGGEAGPTPKVLDLPQVELELQVALPEEPEEPKGPNFWSYLPVLGAILLGVAGISMMASWVGSDPSAGYVLLVIAFVAFLYSIVYVRGEGLMRDLSYEIELLEWKRKVMVWSRLCYCYRDGVVFDPQSNEYTDPEEIESLLQTS